MATVPASQSKGWTYEDVRRLPEDGKRHEVIDGKLYVSPSPSTPHQTASRRLQFCFYELERQGLGFVYDAPTDLLIQGGTPVVPDLIYLLASQQSLITKRAIEGAPHLVVEILSPSTSRLDRIKKLNLYARNRIPHYWLLHPTERYVQMHKLVGEGYLIRGTLEAGDVFESPDFPGLRLSGDELFAPYPGEHEDAGTESPAP